MTEQLKKAQKDFNAAKAEHSANPWSGTRDALNDAWHKLTQAKLAAKGLTDPEPSPSDQVLADMG